MIATVGHLRMPAEKLKELTPALNEAVAAARTQDGCLYYAFAEDLSEPGLLRVSEVWRDMDAINGHTSKPHFAALGQALAGAGITEQVVNLYPATEVIPFGG